MHYGEAGGGDGHLMIYNAGGGKVEGLVQGPVGTILSQGYASAAVHARGVTPRNLSWGHIAADSSMHASIRTWNMYCIYFRGISNNRHSIA